MTRDSDGCVWVTSGADGRTVPCDAEWEKTVWEAAVHAGSEGLLIGGQGSKNTVSSLLDGMKVSGPVDRPDVTRLRYTWGIRLLRRGVSLQVLKAAGMSMTGTLGHLLTFVPEPSRTELAVLRGDV